MSILNRASDGLFNVLIVLVRTIVAEGPLPKDRLLALCAPGALHPPPTQQHASNTLNRWLELGLITPNENDAIEIAPAYKLRLSKRTFSDEALVQCIRDCVLGGLNNERFWFADENRSADFTRATAWMLAQDVHSLSIGGYDDVEAIVNRQISSSKDHPIFQNDTRWPGYVSWSTYLGFGCTLGSKYLVDPTLAVSQYSASCLDEKRDTEVRIFLNRLAEAIPVIDGGRYRQLVEAQLDASAWVPPKPDEISSSLSRALLRLHEAGDIELRDLADAPFKVSLLGRQRRTIRLVSHVRSGGGK